ncbi:MAG: hydrogenase [Deltaproteobacteria bacterium]|nr:MAG: hydrogenase [Deltaproteobacteria bacterium]
MSTYTDTIRRWAADDRRAGPLADADGTGEVGLGAGEAGTRLAVRFALRLRGDRAETVRYQVFGCGFTIAACAAAAELAEGHTLAEIAVIAPPSVAAALGGLPAERGYCADLAVAALQAAVESAGSSRRPVVGALAADDDHAPRVTAAAPLYRLLTDSPAPPGAPAVDRHLFACLLTVAAGETDDPGAALGLNDAELADLLHLYFPAVTAATLRPFCRPAVDPLPQGNVDLLQLLLGYLPCDADGWQPVPSLWLARTLACRAARPGHLWRSMGLFARAELTAAIHRHLPALAAANSRGMRWKRFLFKQLCEQAGGSLCQTPDCGACSDYPLCFGEEA